MKCIICSIHILVLTSLAIIGHSQTAVNEYPCSYQISKDTALTEWTCMGPWGQPAGRGSHVGNGQMNRLQVDPHFADSASSGYQRIYACSPTGGLWRSNDAAHSWQCVHSTAYQLPANNIVDIAISHQHPQHLFVATGDGDHSYRQTYDSYNGIVVNSIPSSGVWRSLDEGQSWQNLHSMDNWWCEHTQDHSASVNRVLVHPKDANILFALTSVGLLRTKNALDDLNQVVWERVLHTADSFAANEGWRGLVFHPKDPQTLYASGKNIYVSRDGGDHWQIFDTEFFDSLYHEKWEDGFCKVSTSQCRDIRDRICEEHPMVQRGYSPKIINVATTPAAPDRVYALILADENVRIKKPDNQCEQYGQIGTKWVLECYVYMKAPDDNHAQWHRIFRKRSWGLTASRMSLQVSPTDSNLIYFGIVSLYGTDAGIDNKRLLSGKAIRTQASSGTKGFHVDVHALAFIPNSEQLLVGHDGGFSYRHFLSDRKAKMTFQNKGLSTNLIMTFDHSEMDSLMVIGTQDCGSMAYLTCGRPRWQSIRGGDGYGAQIDDLSGQVFVQANSYLYRWNPATGSAVLESRNRRSTGNDIDYRPYDGTNNWQKAWLPNTFQIINHPDNDRMIWGFTELFERSAINLNTQAVKSEWRILTDGGKLMPDQWRRKVMEFDICESDPNYMYYAFSGDLLYDNKPLLFRTTQGGCQSMAAFKNPHELVCVESIPMDTFYRLGPMQEPFVRITDVCVHPENPHRVWVTFTGFVPELKVWSWTYNPELGEGQWRNEYSENLHNLSVNAILYQKGTDERLYIGTDAGIYYKDRHLSQWKKMPGFPNVRCSELRVHYCSGKLRVSTYGRGMWEGSLLPYQSLGDQNDRTIEGNVVWDQKRALTRNLRIAAGAHLVVNDTLMMPKHGLITVERGGKITLSETALVFNACGEPWHGIELSKSGNFWQKIFGKKAKALIECDSCVRTAAR